MRLQTKIGVASWFAAVNLALVLSYCAGMKARENVLVPAMKMAWVGISSDIDASISLLTVDAASIVRSKQKLMADVLDAGDIPRILMLDWRILHGAALIGIILRLKRGEIGPGVAASLRERLRMFTRALEELT